jgi:hypothetical protein
LLNRKAINWHFLHGHIVLRSEVDCRLHLCSVDYERNAHEDLHPMELKASLNIEHAVSLEFLILWFVIWQVSKWVRILTSSNWYDDCILNCWQRRRPWNDAKRSRRNGDWRRKSEMESSSNARPSGPSPTLGLWDGYIAEVQPLLACGLDQRPGIEKVWDR